ncbi:hypothetical protein L3X38_007419 [Prunus dulcis]|uniref:Uncharacterized protein n=1 Tax=Prunus dulcis TaxID=3755 RepID=A0AAD4ZUP8_PRUDU|nr:hypothetical protein L3X38_007419 [Prunus dulcis]
MFTLIDGVNLIIVLCAVSLLDTLLLIRVISVIILLPRRGRMRSEFESLGLEDLGLDDQNTVYEDVALGKQMTGSSAEGDRSPRSRGEDIALSEETIGLHFGNDRSPIAEDEENALYDETTGRHSRTD